MPEFYSQSAIDAGKGLDAFTRAYIECLYFTESSPCDDVEIEGTIYNESELSSEALASIVEDCENFQTDNAELLTQAYALSWYSPESAGHDFWLTRNGHGAGFWDRGLDEPACTSVPRITKEGHHTREIHSLGHELTGAAKTYGSADVYLGDDGLVYL